VWTVAAAGLLLSGVLLRGGAPGDPLALWLLTGAAATFLWGLLRHGR
jgi:hypothetical protein